MKRSFLALLVVPLTAGLPACGTDEAVLASAESEVFATVLDGWCVGDRPVIVEDWVGGRQFQAGILDFMRRKSAEPISDEVERSFIDRNAQSVTLHSILQLPGCRFMAPGDVTSYTDTAAAYRDGLAALWEGDPEEVPSILRLSRPGFDRDVRIALVRVGWWGGFGMCWGDYLVLRRGEESWVIVDRIQYLVC